MVREPPLKEKYKSMQNVLFGQKNKLSMWK